MISENDINKLKTVFVTKGDLEESESRTAYGFAEVQKQLNILTTDTEELKSGLTEVRDGLTEVRTGLKDLSEEFGEMKQQMSGMEKNIIAAIHDLKDDLVITKKRVTKLENIILAN